MASPRLRLFELLPHVSMFLLWTAVVTFAPAGFFQADPQALVMAAAPPLCMNVAVALILLGEWKSRSAMGLLEPTVPTEWEVIPLDRRKPAGLDRRKRHRHLVVVSARHVRRLPKPTFSYQKRQALGLPEKPATMLNRRRPGNFFRRFSW
ncbi:MAG: hypothetical protein EOP84_32295 [Verrucomicrobiaceae bacterium]|nr:MAG: hypothetical protein EOP84_32295 [Verrucomicrobiaceae bacterium]